MEKFKKELSMVEDYFNRTKPIFDNIEKEAYDYAHSLYSSYPVDEYTDLFSVAEAANEEGMEFYDTLKTMKSNHLLMTISMLYQIWEQQLIKFTIQEMERYLEFNYRALCFGEAKKIFELHGVRFDNTKSWKKIKELRLLVNTIKHGDGVSAKKLRKIRTDFFEYDVIKGTDTLQLAGAVLLDSYSLQVKEKDLNDYLEATKNFWSEMPEKAYSDIETIIHAFEENK